MREPERERERERVVYAGNSVARLPSVAAAATMPVRISLEQCLARSLPKTLAGNLDPEIWRDFLVPVLSAHEKFISSMRLTLCFYTLMPLLFIFMAW